MAFDANKMRELMESKPERQEPMQQPAETGTTWAEDRTAELNTEIQDSAPEETYTFDPEESRANFEGIGTLVSNTFRDIGRAETDYVMAEQGGDEEEIERARVNAIRAPFKESVRQFTAAYAEDDQSPFQTFAQGLRQSSANIEYFMTDDEKLKQAREIEKTINIPAAATLSSTEAMQSAMSAYDYAKKIQAAGGSMDKVYTDYPILKEIAQMDPQAAALALKDLHNIHEVRDIVGGWAAFWKSGNDSYDYGVLKAKDAMEGLTDEEKKRADELKKEMENAPAAPSFFVNPALAMLSGVQSLPEMIYSSANALPYAVTGGVIGAAAAGVPTVGVGLPAGALAGFKKGFDVGLFIEMARPMMGRKYAEYQAMTDENGNRLFTDAQAREWAIAETIPEAFVEVASFKYGAGKAALGEHAKKAVADAMKGVTKPTAGKAFLDLLFGAGKGIMETGVSETIEEGTQGAISDVFDAAIKNAAEKGNGEFTFSGLADTMGEVSWADIGKRAVAQGMEAAPGAFFLGGISAVGGTPMGGVRYGLESRAWNRQWGEMAKTDRTTLSGTIMLEQLQKTVHDSKLQDTAPDVQREIIRNELKETPWKMAYIDVKYALQNEGGLDDVREVGRAAGKTDEEIQQTIEDEGILAVPIESYAQSEASSGLLDSVSFSPDADPMAKIRENAKKAEEEYTRRVTAEAKKQIDLTEAMTKELFPEKQEQDAAMIAIFQNPENPAQGWKEVHDKAVADLDEILAPALSALDRGMGQGTSVVETMNDQGDVTTVRVSNNEEWYSKFYAEHKRKPNKEELREMAKKMMTGEPDAPQVQGWTVSDKETAEMMANEKDRLAAAEQEIRILDNIKERMQELNGTEIQLTAGMTPEAYKVYRTITSNLLRFGGKVGRAARVSALMWARHADVYAKRMQKRGHENYTAMNWLNDTIKGIDEGRNAQGEAYNGQFDAVDQNTYHQFAGEDAETADKIKLAEAQRMEENGASAEDIYKATGWLKGEDGKWRFEIPDNLDKINLGLLRIREHLPLGELYENEDLFEAYPFLRGVMVSEEDMEEGSIGRLDIENNVIFLNADMLATGEEKLKKSIVHEIQHIIQLHEGFAMGGSPADVRGQILSEIQRIKGDVSQNKDAQEKYSAYQEKTLEALNNPTPETWAEMQRAAKEFEEVVKPENKKRFERLMSRMDALEKEYDSQDNNFFLYWRLGGEQEARTTANRAEEWTKKNKEVETASRALNEGMANATKEQRAAVVERIKLAFEIGGTPTEQQIALMEKYESEMGEELTVLCDNYLWERGTLEEFEEDMPHPHSKAIIVFDGKEIPYSEAEQTQPILEILNQSAWHGSPHKFMKFDLGAIGTGEGAQVHGWGLYFAQGRPVAERYRDNLSQGRAVSINGRVYDEPNIFDDSLTHAEQHALGSYLTSGRNIDEAIKKAESVYAENPTPDTKEAVEILKSGSVKSVNETSGSLFEVEIPDNDVLLDEDKTLDEQPEKVKAAIREYYRSRPDSYISDDTDFDLGGSNGRDFYKDVVFQMQKEGAENPQRAASELLNEYGIKGITYEGGRDGRCYVVFDDQAINIIDTYNQEMNGQGIQGRTINYSDGKRLVELFENADESTFLHESGHIFLMDLEKLAAEGDEESIEDLKAVNEWTEWHDGDAAKYKNTPWAKEFAGYEKEIKEAQKAGDKKKLESVLRKWKQERFARAFEIYLKEGKAPSKGLRKVFQDFVKFLEQVYVALVSDGARASAQVEAVMGRLIATDEEIEAAEQDDRYKDYIKAGGEKLMYEDAAETFSRWHEEAKEEARDKLRRIVMRSLTGKLGRKRKEILREERARKEEELSNQPVYLARQAAKETGIKDAWRAYFPGEEGEANWKAADKAAPPIEEAVDAYMRDFESNLDKKEVQDVLTEEAIEEAMSTARSHEKLLRMEQRAFARKAALANNLSVKARTRLEDVERWIDKMPDDGDDKDLGSWHKAITSLKVSNRWTKEELDAIDRLSISASKESAKENFEALRKIIKDRKVGLADLREANKGRIEILRKMAKETIGRQTLAQATQVQTHRKEEKDAAKEAEKLAKKEKWAEAAAAKERELLASFMASEAQKVKNRQDALLKRIRTQLNAKTKLPKDERYWHQHLAYLLRVTDKDAAKPEGLKSLSDIARTLGDGLDVATDDEGRSNILDLMEKLTDENAYQDGYHGMRLSEFEDAADVLTVLYTTGRDKYNLKLTQGKTIGEAVDEILKDTTSYNGAEVRRSTITGNPNRGGVFWSETLERIPGVGDALSKYAQRYGLSMTKPEELINLLGKKAHKYIYDAYDRAAEQEAAMTAQFCGKMEEILSSRYKPEEMREWQARKYSWQGQPVSKENILAMAMNLGNEINMDRLIMGLEANPAELMKFISDHMTEKDWLFCQDVWDLLQTYWPDTVRVEMELNGTRLKPQEARPFTVMTKDAKGNEKEIKLRGGYYPIKYDPDLSTKSKEQSENAEAQSGMSGAVVFGMGRGFTKDRAGKGAVKQRPLFLDLSVIPEHVGEAVHNITTRIAARDVYRIINNKEFRDHIVNTLGQDAYNVLATWATDVWKIKPEQKNSAENWINGRIRRLRQNSGIAIMGYRMWPTIENATNIFPMMDALGAAETMSAMKDYYTNYKEYDELIAKSLFMKERTERMDRDMKGQRGMFQRQNAISEWLVKHAYDPITYTDLLTSKPLWARSYKNAFPKMLEEVRQENEENAKTFETRRAEYEKINSTIIDMKKRRLDMQNELRRRDRREAVLAETDLTRMSRSTLRDEIYILDGEIEDKGKKLFIAGEKMERASTLVIRTEREILEEAEHRAILAADKAVRDVIGSGDVKDLSEVQRSKNEAVKALTMFYSYFNTQANAIISAHWKGKWKGGAKYDFTPIAKAIAYRFLLTAALSTAMRWLFFGEGNDEKDKYKKDKEGNKIEVPALERALKQYAKNALSTTVGGAYGIREIANWAINRYIDGQTYGSGARFDGMYGNFVNQVLKEAELISNKYARDEKAREEEEKRRERYRHMTPAQKKKFREEEKYRRPPNTISYADILRGAGSIGTSWTAGTFGVTEPIANAVLGTMQYIFDSDGRYDATLSNMMWSAFWTKKPVKRTPPEKPEKPKKKGR